jgi:hypothetical protein
LSHDLRPALQGGDGRPDEAFFNESIINRNSGFAECPSRLFQQFVLPPRVLPISRGIANDHATKLEISSGLGTLRWHDLG